jgi:hypothetical protein
VRCSFAFAAVALGIVTVGCSRVEPTPTPDPAEPARPPAPSAHAPAPSAAPVAPLVLARGVRFVKASAESDVAKLVRSERDRASADGRDLVVYVGAKWCEPCQHFHEAAKRGDLDGEFPELTILEFDLDDDRDRIAAAGYGSKMIPLFVFPGPDGRASDRRFEGSVKGNAAVTNIAPRLHKLLAK